MNVKSANLKDFIYSMCITNREVAKRANLSDAVITRAVQGKEIHALTGKKIAKAINVDFPILFSADQHVNSKAKVHYLKILPEYYKDIVKGTKRFEVRKNDRGFEEGDFLRLEEWDKDYTGRYVLCKVLNVFYDPKFCKEGYVIMSIAVYQLRENGDV